MATSPDRFTGQDGFGSLEALEPRTLLTAMVNGAYPSEFINWAGVQTEVVKDSWILTFDHYYGPTVARQLTHQVIAALGVTADPASVEVTALGRWARFSTPTDLSEARLRQVADQFGFLMSVGPDVLKRTDLVPNDARFGEQWGHLNAGQNISGQDGVSGADIDATLAWDLQTGQRQVIIAVLDTGHDVLHPDLAANTWFNPREIPGNNIDDDGNGFVDDVNGYDFSGNGDANVRAGEGNDHGVAVAGTIGAVGNNGIGVAGVAWNVTLLPVKIFPDAEGGAATFDIIEGLEYITMLRTQFGVNIVAANGSYGAVASANQDFFNDAESIAVQAFTDSGALFIASAGNDSLDNDGAQANYPASYPNPYIISVAATDNRDELAGFSNYGATKVDIGAPGVQVLTTALGGGYQFIDGTSFSSPYTAGVVALLASASPFATQDQLKAALLGGAEQIPALAGRVATGGRLNANESLRLIGFPGPIVLDINPGAVSGPVDVITIGFSKVINPTFVDAAGIELIGANLDNDFNGNDTIYTFSDSDIQLLGSVLRITIPVGTLPIDRYRLTLRNEFFRDLQGNFLNGTTAGGNDQVHEFRIVAGGGPNEPNDSMGEATPVILSAAGTALFTNVVIGDGDNKDALGNTLDVDIYRVTMSGPGLITVRVDARSLPSPSTLDSVLRLFDAGGRELARNDNFFGLDSRVQFFVPTGGRYYIGVSGFGNSNYLPGQVASGVAGESEGTYDLSIEAVATQPEQVTFSSSGSTTIPASGTVTSTIFVPDIRRLKDLNVLINITHGYVGDLQISLISPGGTTVPLALNRGGSSSLGFVNTLFDDAAVVAIGAGVAPFTGAFKPESELSVLNNQSAAGFWTLRITDNRPLNGGTLTGWSLQMLLENSVSGPFEFNDTLATATDAQLGGAGSRTFEASIGDGAYGHRDVDLFRFVAPAGTTVTATITLPAFVGNGSLNPLDTILRLFDQQGNVLLIDNRPDSRTATISFPVQFAGTFFLGVSGAPNAAYDPDRGGSGAASPESGDYVLTITIVGGITNGALVLDGQTIDVGVAADGAIAPSTGQDTAIGLGEVEFLSPAGNPAGVESFYGATFDGFSFRNSGVATELPVKVTNESDFSNRRATVEGLFRSVIPQNDQGGGLLVRRSVSFGVNDSFIAIDVSLTNTTFGALGDVAWVEAFRPRQSDNLGSLFTRTIVNVQNGTSRLATSTFKNTDFPGGATIGIGSAAPAAGQAVTVSVELPGTVRDPFQVIDTPRDPDPSAGDLGVDAEGLLSLAYDLGTLGAGQTESFRYFIFVGPTLAGVQAQFAALNSGIGTGHLVADPANPSIASSNLPYALYYPEGYANNRASSFLPLVNPHDADARVVVIARYENTALPPTVLFDGTVEANSRGGITLTTPQLYAAGTQLVHKDTPYALEVRSSLPIGATLSHFDFGIATGQAFTSETSKTWTFSEGFKGAGVADFLVFYNPNNFAVKATLTVYQETSSQVFQVTQQVGAHRRSGWDLNALPQIPKGPFAMKLETDEGPVVAALSHFDENLHGGFSVLGLPNTGSTVGLSPEGQVGLNAGTEFVTILNSGLSPTVVTFTFFFENQSAYRTQVFVPPQRRSGFNVAELPGFPKVGQAYSVGYESEQPVTVTTSTFAFDTGTGTRFSDTARTFWLFSDGFKPGSGTAVTEYLRLFNPAAQELTVEITLDFAAVPAQGNLPAIPAGSETFRRVLTGRAANDFNIHDFVTGDRATRDVFYSVTVKSPTPVVAYTGHFDRFFGGGFGTLGTSLGGESAAIV